MYFLLALDFVPLFLYENRFIFIKCALSKLYKNVFFLTVDSTIHPDGSIARTTPIVNKDRQQKKKEIPYRTT